MKKIEEIDKNFIVKDITVREGTKIYNVCEKPFSIHGVFAPEDSHEAFYRMNRDVAARVNDGVAELNNHCTGGRVRFKTNSSYIAIKAVMSNVAIMPHFALTGSAGFDLYSDEKHIATFQPKVDVLDTLFGEYNSGACELREYTLNLPLYSGIKELYIILDEDAVVESAKPYKNHKPVVFYGSSITQGGCASRPGTAYTAIVSRRLELDYVNLGFSGSARGETEMAEYIAGLDMSMFIFDYDHNAPSAEHLGETHDKFFKIIRKAHPYMPIICVSQPAQDCKDYKERAHVIETTVLDARGRGDENVCFVNMGRYLENEGVLNEATVDRCHPNDLGFYYMAKAVEGAIKKFLV